MIESNSSDPGVKKLTIENWQKADDASLLWRQMTAVPKTADDWGKLFLEAKIRPEVPIEIAKLLEVARAAMMCSWYYYPLATLGMEQCYRVMEAGVRLRCEKAGIPTTTASKGGKEKDKTFKENIEALKSQNIILSTDELRLEKIRSLRNNSSHPKQRSIFDPGEAETMLSSVVEDLNDLFREAIKL